VGVVAFRRPHSDTLPEAVAGGFQGECFSVKHTETMPLSVLYRCVLTERTYARYTISLDSVEPRIGHTSVDFCDKFVRTAVCCMTAGFFSTSKVLVAQTGATLYVARFGVHSAKAMLVHCIGPLPWDARCKNQGVLYVELPDTDVKAYTGIAQPYK
jgi:hypothetical protein